LQNSCCLRYAILFQGSIAFQNAYFICGDIHEKAVNRTQCNLEHPDCGTQRSYVDLLHWDATNLVLRDSSVDIFITDLVSGTHIVVLMLAVI
jgi:tRNA G10  N-methylase Trm11